MATHPTAMTSIYRRWHNTQKGYIDHQGNIIPTLEACLARLPELKISYPGVPDPETPPSDGSIPFLRLPTELRLEIYRYLTQERNGINETFDSQFGAAASINARRAPASTTYAYLYRSPGRVTKPNATTPEVIRLFQVNHQMREELLDSCFGDRTFVLEASLYSRHAGGLDVLPPRLGTTAWVKRLLLITTLDQNKGSPKGIADLRPLQEMVNLKELRILFRAMDPVDELKVANDPIRALLSCVPAHTKVSIGFDEALKEELRAELGLSMDYLFDQNANAAIAYERFNAILSKLRQGQGTLSRSRVNHGNCRFPTCQEQGLGISCINAQTPGALPPVNADTSRQSIEPLKYRCGCAIRVGDGGHANHKCSTKPEGARPLASPTRKLASLAMDVDRDNWRASWIPKRWRSGGRQQGNIFPQLQ